MHVYMDSVASSNALSNRRRRRALHEMAAFDEETPSSAVLMVHYLPGMLTKRKVPGAKHSMAYCCEPAIS